MSNYNKTTNFTAKDSLPNGDPSKVVLGAEVDTEFDNIQTAVNTKADKFIPATANNLAALSSAGNLADSGKAYPTGDVVGTTDTQTLTNKTLTSPTENGGTYNTATIPDPTITFTSPSSITNLGADTVDGADASVTPTADTIPIADGTGKIADGWLNGLALNTLSKTVASTGTQVLAIGANWVPPAGYYQFAYDNTAGGLFNLEYNITAAWRLGAGVSGSGGLVVCDGTNMRIVNNAAATGTLTIYYQKF